MCILENPRKTSIFTKPEIKKNRRFALGPIRVLNTTKRGILQSPQDMHFGNILGIQGFLRSQSPQDCSLENPRKTSLSTKPKFQKSVELNTRKRGIFQSSQDVHSAITLGKQVLYN